MFDIVVLGFAIGYRHVAQHKNAYHHFVTKMEVSITVVFGFVDFFELVWGEVLQSSRLRSFFVLPVFHLPELQYPCQEWLLMTPASFFFF